jgi:hypothetical protein
MIGSVSGLCLTVLAGGLFCGGLMVVLIAVAGACCWNPEPGTRNAERWKR